MATQTSSFACYMQPHSGPFLSILYGGFLRSVSSHRIWGPPQISFFAYYGGLLMSVFLCILYRGPSDQFLCMLYWGPQLTFFAYYVRASSDQFLLIQYGGPSQISFFAYYMPPPLRLVSLHAIGGGGGTSDQFLRKIYGALSDSFFCLLYGAPSG